MLTPARLSQHWQNARYRRLLRELLAGRPEADLGLGERFAGPLPAAAMALLRLGELRQSDLPVARPFREHLLLCQQRSGAFGEGAARPICTALCIRGLHAISGSNEWRHLVRLVPEKTVNEGIPDEPVPAAKRVAGTLPGIKGFLVDQPARGNVPAAIARGIGYLAWAQAPGGEWCDGLTTAFVLLQLGRIEAFRRAVRIGAALECRRQPGQATPERLAWLHVSLRCGGALCAAAMQQAGDVKRHRAAPLFANVA